MPDEQDTISYQQLVEALHKLVPDEEFRAKYDYTIPGYYALTINAFDFRWFFGKVLGNEMHLNEHRRIAQQVWQSLPEKFPQIRLHEYVFMPNHMHGIVELMDVEGSDSARKISLWEVIRHFKAKTTYNIRHSEGRPWFAWQDGSWKTVLYNDKILYYMRRYIINNPVNWREDKLYKKSLRGGQYSKHER